MQDVATRTVDAFLRLQRTLVIETREFREKRHNDDLCPLLQHQLEVVLDATGRFEPVVYDTQGFNDDGADVIVRVRHARRLDYEPSELIGFQVKSFGDFRQKDLFRTLKAQRDDAMRKVRQLSTYYVLLCTDEQEDKDAIRRIEAEFKDADRTIIIEPTFALGFLRLSRRRIEGVVTRLQQADDFVFRSALAAVALPTPTAGILAVYLAACASEGKLDIDVYSLQARACLERLYSATLTARRLAAEEYKRDVESDDAGDTADWRLGYTRQPTEQDFARMSEDFFDDFTSALGQDIDIPDTNLLNMDGSSGRILIRQNELLPVIALLTDAKVRHGLDGDELFLHGAEALGLGEEWDESWRPATRDSWWGGAIGGAEVICFNVRHPLRRDEAQGAARAVAQRHQGAGWSGGAGAEPLRGLRVSVPLRRGQVLILRSPWGLRASA